jgi:hypothetical protein
MVVSGEDPNVVLLAGLGPCRQLPSWPSGVQGSPQTSPSRTCFVVVSLSSRNPKREGADRLGQECELVRPVGKTAELIVSPNPDGTYTLEQSSDDSGTGQADNPQEIQGDGHGDEHANAEQQCLALSNDSTFAAHGGLTFGSSNGSGSSGNPGGSDQSSSSSDS